MKLIFRYMQKKDKIISAVVMLFVIVQVALETKIPVIMRDISTMLQEGNMTMDAIRSKGLLMTAYALIAFAASSIVCYLVIDTACRLCNVMRTKVFARILDFSLSEVSSFGTGTLISRCNDDIEAVQGFMTQSLQSLIRAPLLLLLVFFRLSGTQALWIIMSVAAILLLFALVFYMFKSIAPFISRSSIVNDRMISSVQEHIYGIREIHLGNRFSSQEEEYNKLNKLNAHYNFKVKSAMCLFSPGTSTLIYSLTVAIYVSGAFLIKNEEQVRQMADFSSMVSFVSFIAFIFTALIDIVLVLLAIPSLLNSQNRILEVLNTKNSIVDGAYQGQPAEHGTVAFDQVSFAYPGSDKYAIEDISFRIQSGQTVAFIGGTGAGKTTVLNLMLRLYEAAEGEILVDGIPVRDYRLKELRNLMGYVPQQNYLFTGTIAGNIGYGENGRFQAALEEIQKAAVVGQADSFIREKQGGYYGQVYAGGSNFSGGQRQRLTISRAICRDPEIYIFDDSFSALDFETDAKLRKALKKTTKGATVIIVAQRISSVRDADRIIVMDSGRIVDQGTHEELLARCRIYQEIASSQNPEEKAV